MPTIKAVTVHETRTAITELVAGSETIEEYRREMLVLLDKLIGFDLASVQGTVGGAVHPFVMQGYNAVVEAQVREQMLEFTAQELRSIAGPGFSLDLEWLSPSRRDSLAIYRETMRPEGVAATLTRLWRSRFGGYGMHLARAGAGRRFSATERRMMDELAPHLELAEVAMAGHPFRIGGSKDATGRLAGWSRDRGFSPREQAVAELVVRGLRNREIAEVTGTSQLTVRNQLSSIFRKAEVTTRSELVFDAMEDVGGGGVRVPAVESAGSSGWIPMLVHAPPRTGRRTRL